MTSNELLPLPCGRWKCPVCGPAKAWRLGELVAFSGAERWITLSKASEDVREAYKRLSQLARSLRRRGYRFEYLAVPERHKNGSWHFHLLQKGSFIPQRELSMLSARAGMGKIVHIKRIEAENPTDLQKVSRYLVKYMVKDGENFPPNVRRFSNSQGFWGIGGRAALEASRFPKPDDSPWSVVHLGSAEIRGEDGAILWHGSTPGACPGVE